MKYFLIIVFIFLFSLISIGQTNRKTYVVNYDQNCGFSYNGDSIYVKLLIFERSKAKIKLNLILWNFEKSWIEKKEFADTLIGEAFNVSLNNTLIDEIDECVPEIGFKSDGYVFEIDSCRIQINLSIYSDRAKIYDINNCYSKKRPFYPLYGLGTLRRLGF